MAYLAARPLEVIAHAHLLEEVFGYREGVRTGTLATTVRRLRAALAAVGGEGCIEAIYGAGYRFVPAPRSDAVLLGRSDLLTAVDGAYQAGAWCVTLVAFGGMGKTTVARAWRGEQGCWCELGGSGSVSAVLAQGLGLPPSADAASLYVNAQAIGRIVFDQVEGHLEEVSRLLLDWSTRPSPPRVLLTSRIPLGLGFERVIAVPPLDIEHAARLASDAAAAIGVMLLPEAARRVGEAVDGHPLSIRLAAARLRLVPEERLLDDLEARLDRLRGVEAREGSVAETVRTSVELLPEQALGVLSAAVAAPLPFDLDQIEAWEGPCEPELVQLVDLQLIQREREGLRVHPVVRQGMERLCRDRVERARQRWLAWVVRRASVDDPSTRPTRAELESALAWTGHGDERATVVAALGEAWRRDGGSVQRLIELLDPSPDASDPVVRCRLDTLGAIAFRDTDPERALVHANRALEVASGGERAIEATYQLGRVQGVLGVDNGPTLERLDSVPCRTPADRFLRTLLVALLHHSRGEQERALARLRASEPMHALGRRADRFHADSALAAYLMDRGFFGEARFHLERAASSVDPAASYLHAHVALDTMLLLLETGAIEEALALPRPPVATVWSRTALHANTNYALQTLARFDEAEQEAVSAHLTGNLAPRTPAWVLGVNAYADDLRVRGNLEGAWGIYQVLEPSEREQTGLLAAQAGRLDEALELQRQRAADRRHPRVAHFRDMRLVEILLAAGRLSEARALAASAARHRPRSLESWALAILGGQDREPHPVEPRSRAWSALVRRDRAALAAEEARFSHWPATAEPRWRLAAVRRLMTEALGTRDPNGM
ncbi:MAG: winged helix-turn-helix transcriptional regulator [Myxococcales bacterium]|nr:winged helix-turn-helix transcriptional regulator [Myxococcales bacterium]